MSGDLIGLIAASGALGAAMATVIVKLLSRGTDRATANKLSAETRESAQRAASAEVQTLLDIITEVRQGEAAKAQRIDDLERRMELLEERERHMLTRAAVHEAWDQMAFAHIVAHGGGEEFPKPPPLIIGDKITTPP
jgi:hypothetical protein